MMEKKDVLELISAFDASALTELEIEEETFRLRLRRDRQGKAAEEAANAAAGVRTASTPGSAAGTDREGSEGSEGREGSESSEGREDRRLAQPDGKAAAVQKEDGEKTGDKSGGNILQVKAPLVGVFYASPSPEEAPYVTEGQKVEAGQVLCLLEAMKMMNELKSPVSGVIRKICGKNGGLAEYDQVLFEVEKC